VAVRGDEDGARRAAGGRPRYDRGGRGDVTVLIVEHMLSGRAERLRVPSHLVMHSVEIIARVAAGLVGHNPQAVMHLRDSGHAWALTVIRAHGIVDDRSPLPQISAGLMRQLLPVLRVS